MQILVFMVGVLFCNGSIISYDRTKKRSSPKKMIGLMVPRLLKPGF